MAAEPIRIKRYPNRRFYSSNSSKYVSLKEIEQLICEGQTVEIVDSQTEENLTRAILVQIIVERHPDKIAMFPTAMLHSILRANDVMVSFLQEYFRNSLAYLDYFQKHGASEPLGQPMHWMKAWLDNLSERPQSTPSGSMSPTQLAPPDEGALHERIARLERRIAELEEENVIQR